MISRKKFLRRTKDTQVRQNVFPNQSQLKPSFRSTSVKNTLKIQLQSSRLTHTKRKWAYHIYIFKYFMLSKNISQMGITI